MLQSIVIAPPSKLIVSTPTYAPRAHDHVISLTLGARQTIRDGTLSMGHVT